MHGVVATLGLSCWNPDVMSTDPNSMYNILHEKLVIQTFQHIMISHGYAHFGINHEQMKMSLLKQLYCSFVYGRMQNLMKCEHKSPGGVQRDTMAMNMYKQRSDVHMSCNDYFIDFGLTNFNPAHFCQSPDFDIAQL